MPKPLQPQTILAAVLLVVAVALLQIAVGVGLAALDDLWSGALLPPEWSSSTAALGVVNLIAMGGAVAWIRHRAGIPWREFVPWRVRQPNLWPPAFLLVLGSGVVLSEVDNYVVAYLPDADFWLAQLGLEIMAREPWALAVVAIGVAPLTEEALFRGVILRGLLPRGRWRAIFVSAALFAIAHLNPLQIAGTLALGVVAGWFYVRTRSLGLCFAAHAFQNALVTVALLAPVEIPGLTPPRDSTAVMFQPWWLTLLAAVATVVGAVLFHRRAPRRGPITELPPPAPDVESSASTASS